MNIIIDNNKAMFLCCVFVCFFTSIQYPISLNVPILVVKDSRIIKIATDVDLKKRGEISHFSGSCTFLYPDHPQRRQQSDFSPLPDYPASVAVLRQKSILDILYFGPISER